MPFAHFDTKQEVKDDLSGLIDGRAANTTNSRTADASPLKPADTTSARNSPPLDLNTTDTKVISAPTDTAPSNGNSHLRF